MASDTKTPNNLPDVQSASDERRIAINRVGVSDVSYPIRFKSAGRPPQSTTAVFDMFVSLSADRKGTHMSRFLQLLADWDTPFSNESLSVFCDSLCHKLESDNTYLRVRFPYFVDRAAPVTGETGKIRLDVTIDVESGSQNDLVTTLSGPATSLCPCSKEISERGAHNQRCELSVSTRLKPNAELSVEELFQMMEQSASTQVFPALKRPDEKWVTEDAFDNPKFVEDIVRDLALALESDDRIAWYRCSSENFESIHQHNAFAEIVSDSSSLREAVGGRDA